MKITTANDIREFNAALDKCTSSVWLIGANDEAYNMKNEEEYIEGILRLTEDHDEQLGIFTVTYEDEMIMADFIVKMAA
jgi:hypothetical protein